MTRNQLWLATIAGKQDRKKLLQHLPPDELDELVELLQAWRESGKRVPREPEPCSHPPRRLFFNKYKAGPTWLTFSEREIVWAVAKGRITIEEAIDLAPRLNCELTDRALKEYRNLVAKLWPRNGALGVWGINWSPEIGWFAAKQAIDSLKKSNGAGPKTRNRLQLSTNQIEG